MEFERRLKAISKKVDAAGSYRMIMYYMLNSYARCKFRCTKYEGKWYVKDTLHNDGEYLADQDQVEQLERLWLSEENIITI